VGLGRVELPTSRLSGVRSNHLSYRPIACSRRLAPRACKVDRRRKATMSDQGSQSLSLSGGPKTAITRRGSWKRNGDGGETASFLP